MVGVVLGALTLAFVQRVGMLGQECYYVGSAAISMKIRCSGNSMMKTRSAPARTALHPGHASVSTKTCPTNSVLPKNAFQGERRRICFDRKCEWAQGATA